MNTKTMTPDERLIEASKHYKINDDGELERVSWPYEAKYKKPKMGVGFDYIEDSGYKRFAHRSHMGKKRQMIFSHRMVFFLVNNFLPSEVDHMDNNKLNNHPDNLRAADRKENTRNSTSRKWASSKYLGVSWFKACGKWRATIRTNKKQTYLGLFTNEIEAAKAYDAKAIELFGEFANPNFPA